MVEQSLLSLVKVVSPLSWGTTEGPTYLEGQDSTANVTGLLVWLGYLQSLYILENKVHDNKQRTGHCKNKTSLSISNI